MSKKSLDLLNEHEAAPIAKKSVYWLRSSRVNGTGPRYRKIGGSVFYDKEDILSWLKNHKLQNSVKEDEKL
jgi:predicted DNA-binding transcriptional regulator AlpA